MIISCDGSLLVSSFVSCRHRSRRIYFDMKGLLLIYLLLKIGGTYGGIPLFVWSNDRTAEFPNVVAGNHISNSEFSTKYLKHTGENIIVFIQDKLSLSEILSHGGVYGNNGQMNYNNLKSFVSEYPSAFYPSVDDPIDSLLNVNRHNSHKFIKMLAEEIASELPNVDPKEKSLILIDFSGGLKGGKKPDEIVGEVVSNMKDKGTFTAFFTGRYPQMVEVSDKHQNMRHLLESLGTETERPIINGNFMLKFESLHVGKSVNRTVGMDSVTVEGNTCNGFNSSGVPSKINCSVVLGVQVSSTEMKNMTLTLVFATSAPINAGYWYVKENRLSYTNGTDLVSVAMKTGLVDPTPFGFSYSCYDQPSIVALDYGNGSHANVPFLKFDGFQMEVFMANSSRFGHYNDCVGFFTIGIWMFLICAAVLLSVLMFGVVMLLGINTMDRYDDPKGKTISVGTGE